MTLTSTEHKYIQLNESNDPIIEGTSMKVVELITSVKDYGTIPEELLKSYPHLTMSKIYSALAYYWDHKQEIDAALELKDQYVERLRKEKEILRKTFLELAQQWRRETRFISSTNEAAMHPAYQQIIGIGKEVVPLLLQELEKSSGRWFWALKSITREDPVPPEKRGKTKEMIKAWLDWGRRKGYTW
ncbi:MAG: DUF433 domain-containing protein [Xenococcaceae cyanobacterium]